MLPVMRLPPIPCILLLASLAHADTCVVLLHGLARSSRSMEPMAAYLAQHGYRPVNVDYPSTHHPIDTLADMAIARTLERLEPGACSRIDFVTHSMGGILVRKHLSRHGVANLGRVVMLGPPNHGSEVVDNLKEWALFGAINGPAGGELGTDSNATPVRLGGVDFELGVIAGDRSINWINSAMIEGPDDGKVSVESSRIEGMKDHIVMHVTHPLMMRDEDVMAQVLAFLRHGRFERSGER